MSSLTIGATLGCFRKHHSVSDIRHLVHIRLYVAWAHNLLDCTVAGERRVGVGVDVLNKGNLELSFITLIISTQSKCIESIRVGQIAIRVPRTM